MAAMPKFTVDHKTQQAPDQAFSTIKAILSKEGEFKKFDANAQISFDDAGKSASIKGGQFKADMKVTSNGPGSQVVVTVDLPLLLTPFKGKVQETLQKMLAKHLA